eukprot:7776686-Pyramimonas_sp.AAC.1
MLPTRGDRPGDDPPCLGVMPSMSRPPQQPNEACTLDIWGMFELLRYEAAHIYADFYHFVSSSDRVLRIDPRRQRIAHDVIDSMDLFNLPVKKKKGKARKRDGRRRDAAAKRRRRANAPPALEDEEGAEVDP